MNPIQSIINIPNDYQNNSLNVLFYLSQQNNFKNFITCLNFEDQQKLLEGFCKNFVASYSSEQELVKPILKQLINLIDYKKMVTVIRNYKSDDKKDFFIHLINEYKQLSNYTDLFFEHDKKYLLHNINTHNLMPTIVYHTGNTDNIAQLVKAGADLNISQPQNKLLCLHVGITFEKFRTLFELGADPFCESNDSSYYKLLVGNVKNNKDRNENNEQILAFINDTLKNSTNKENALIQSIKEKNKESFNDLFLDDKRKIRDGVNINYQDSDGKTMLHHALDHFYPAIVNSLLKKGADTNIVDNDGHTPLFYAFSDKYKDYGTTAAEKITVHNIMKSISETLDFNTQNKKGATVLKDIGDTINYSRLKVYLSNIITEDFLQYTFEKRPYEDSETRAKNNLVVSRQPKEKELAFYNSLFKEDNNGKSFWQTMFELKINEDRDGYIKKPLKNNSYESKDDFKNYTGTYWQLAYAVSVINEGANQPISEQIRSLIYLTKDDFNKDFLNISNKETSIARITKIAESISNQIDNKESLTKKEIDTITSINNQFFTLISDVDNPFEKTMKELEKSSFNLLAFIEKTSLSLDKNHINNKKNNFKV